MQRGVGEGSRGGGKNVWWMACHGWGCPLEPPIGALVLGFRWHPPGLVPVIICGASGELTFGHAPPRASFNERPVL